MSPSVVCRVLEKWPAGGAQAGSGSARGPGFRNPAVRQRRWAGRLSGRDPSQLAHGPLGRTRWNAPLLGHELRSRAQAHTVNTG